MANEVRNRAKRALSELIENEAPALRDGYDRIFQRVNEYISRLRVETKARPNRQYRAMGMESPHGIPLRSYGNHELMMRLLTAEEVRQLRQDWNPDWRRAAQLEWERSAGRPMYRAGGAYFWFSHIP